MGPGGAIVSERMEVDYYSSTKTLFVNGEKSTHHLRVDSRFGQPTEMLLDGKRVGGPWTLNIHCRDGSVQTITDGDRWARR